MSSTITIVTVCLNAADTIAGTIESVRAQGDDLHEYIIVDGGSSDVTTAILASAEPAFGGKMSWTSESDAGIYDAMNKGIGKATGEFLMVLGADDLLLDGALEAVSNVVVASPDADLIFGDAYVVEPDGRSRLQRGSATRRLVGGVPWAMPVCHQACAFSSRAYRQLGGFDTSFRIAGDYELYLRFHRAGLASVHIDMPLVAYSLTGVSSRAGRATADEYRRARVLHGVDPSLAYVLMLRSMVLLTLGRIMRRTNLFERFLGVHI